MGTPEYGVGLTNMFDVLGEDGGMAPVKKAKQPKKEKEVEAPKQPVRNDNKPARGGKDRHTGPRRGGGRGRGAGHRAPKHDGMDRNSANGAPRYSASKKEGHGRYNWGSKDEAAAQAEAVEEAAAAPVEEKAAEVAAVEAEPEVAAVEEEQDATMSWDEWQAALAAKRVEDDINRNRREVQNDEKQWKVVAELKREEEDAEEEDDSKQKKSKKGPKGKLSLAEFVGDVVPARPARRTDRPEGQFRGEGRGEFRGEGRGRGRGGRGGRGRGGRGAFRGGRGADSNVNITDESDFPKLK